MNITSVITDAISKIALDRNIDENDVNWHQIAIELASEIIKLKKS